MSEPDPELVIALFVDAVDTAFGWGYAAAHPELLAAHLQAVAMHRIADSIESISITVNHS